MNPLIDAQRLQTRRQFFGRTATGVGIAALATLLGREGLAARATPSIGRPDLPHFAPRAKSVIYMFQNGGPTHVELFDHKPALTRFHGQPVPAEYMEGRRFSTMSGNPDDRVLLGAVEPFKQYGQSGAWVSDFLPHTARIVDDICFVKSLYTEQVNHAPAITFFLTGEEFPGRPSLGAWLAYGLGSENQNLPAFVVMTSATTNTTCGQIFYQQYWGSGFLPSRYQGVNFRSGGDPVLYLSNPPGMSREMRRGILDDLAQLNTLKLEDFGDPEISTRISQYEMAFRMQASVPELTDISNEPASVLEMYGPDVKRRGSYAYNCLMARRLVERGVRFVQVMHAGWDQHFSLTTELYANCKETDQPSAALVQDLKQRGLLDDTLVIWGGEFGRTPFLQGKIDDRPRWGRDHHPHAFTIWMAGGGVRPGLTYGESDDLAMNVAKDPVHVHDFQATVLHQLGIDHERLTFRFQGRNFRLTDVHGFVKHDVLA